MKNSLYIIIMIVIWVSCRGEQMQRSPTPAFGFSNKITKAEENTLASQMETALLIDDDDDECYKKVEALLKAGADPNKKTGQFKWLDTNPLWNSNGNYTLSKLFISYGADVKRRPYIARLLSYRIIAAKNPRANWVEFYKENPQMKCRYEDEIFLCCKLLLESGTDPNLKAYGASIILWPATDWNYRRYFNKHGDTAINYCIKENLLSVFPLLLQYGTVLDTKSLELAEETTERTGSTEMEDLVKAQWEKQNGN